MEVNNIRVVCSYLLEMQVIEMIEMEMKNLCFCWLGDEKKEIIHVKIKNGKYTSVLLANVPGTH